MLGIFRRKIILKLILTLVTIVSLGSIASVIYFNNENKINLSTYLNQNVANLINLAKQGYIFPVYSFDMRTIKDLNKAFLQNKFVLAVNVYSDFKFVTGMERQNNGELKEMSAPSQIRETYYIKKN